MVVDRARSTSVSICLSIYLSIYLSILTHNRTHIHALHHHQQKQKQHKQEHHHLSSLMIQLVKIESDYNEHAINFISDAEVENWPHRRGRYLQFLTRFVGYDVPEWMVLEQDDDCEHLFVFLSSDVWAQFSQTQPYVQFKLSTLLGMLTYINRVLSCFRQKRGSSSWGGIDVVLLPS